MDPLPSLAPTSYTIADHLSKPLPTTTHQRLITLIGAGPTVDPTATADLAATATVATAPTSTSVSATDSVPLLHPNQVPYLLDTGASFPLAPASSDFSTAPFGLLRSASVSVASNSKASSKVYSTDPYTLITGEDTATASSVDLSSPDLFALESDLVESFDIWEFGTATLVFISNSKLTTILVEPTVDWTDWFDWIPLPRLTPTES